MKTKLIATTLLVGALTTSVLAHGDLSTVYRTQKL